MGWLGCGCQGLRQLDEPGYAGNPWQYDPLSNHLINRSSVWSTVVLRTVPSGALGRKNSVGTDVVNSIGRRLAKWGGFGLGLIMWMHCATRQGALAGSDVSLLVSLPNNVADACLLPYRNWQWLVVEKQPASEEGGPT